MKIIERCTLSGTPIAILRESLDSPKGTYAYAWKIDEHGADVVGPFDSPGHAKRDAQRWARENLSTNPVRERPIHRAGVSRKVYLRRPSQISRGRPGARLLARRAANLRGGKAGYFPNPRNAGPEAAWQFFLKHAGFSYKSGATEREKKNAQARGARKLADAERRATQNGYSFSWETDTIDSSDFSDDPNPWALWICVMRDPQGRVVESLSGIDFGRDGEPYGDPYARVVQAELALEHFAGGMKKNPTITKRTMGGGRRGMKASDYAKRKFARVRRRGKERFSLRGGTLGDANFYRVQVARGKSWITIDAFPRGEFGFGRAKEYASRAAHRFPGKKIRVFWPDTVKKNPAARVAHDSRIAAAARRFQSFTGHRAGGATPRSLPVPRVGLEVGPVLMIGYEATRDGKREKYLHRFAKKARPLLAASHDGRDLVLIGGSYQFTNRGIVDRR